MKISVKEIAEFVQAQIVGNGEVAVSGIASLHSASPQDLVFVEDAKHLRAAFTSSAAAVLAGDFAADKTSPKPLLIAKHPKLAFARAARLLYPRAGEAVGIHKSAIVDPTAILSSGVSIDARAIIGGGVYIGKGTRIAAACVIGAGIVIGQDCEIYPNVTIYPGTTLGNRVIVHAGAVLGSDGFGYVRDKATGHYEKFPQIGRLEIGDDVEIGANATIDRGALEVTRIARGAKIDNLVHIGHNCQIGEDVVVAAQTGLSGSVTLEKNVLLGGQVGIGEGARIEEGVMLGGQGGVLPGKVLRGKGEAFWGTPARPLREYLKQLAVIARLAKKN
ncbi:MAG TPA: UDP-3-O-(3-hydroxymyristoyl)glucosamine N-acyltransferase [Terriglobales bacterium]|nr:UDP-3-O-(3-hydroxymyristoyl)glucosamine N-acyltransferase [Terriglobales bacterium]